MKTLLLRVGVLLTVLACSTPRLPALAQFVELSSPNEEINGNFGIAVKGAGDVNGCAAEREPVTSAA